MRMFARHCHVSETAIRSYYYGANSTMKTLQVMVDELNIEVKDLL